MNKNDTTTTQKTEYPQYIEDAQKALTTTGLGMITPFLQAPQYSRAGMTQDQLMAGDLARKSAHGAFGNNYAGQIAGAGGGYTPSLITADGINSMMNPYLDAILDPAMTRMRGERDNSLAQSAAQSANGVAFGGSGSALRDANIMRGFNQDSAELEAGLRGQAYDKATQAALQNAQMQNQAGQFNSQQSLAALLGANNAESDAFNRQQTALATLLGYGGRTQSEAQANLDIPWMNLQRGLSLIPGVAGTTVSTQPDNSPSFLQQLLGAGLAVGGMAVPGGGSLAGNWLSGLMR